MTKEECGCSFRERKKKEMAAEGEERNEDRELGRERGTGGEACSIILSHYC